MLDLGTREVTAGDLVVTTTAREFDLLAFLAASPRQVFSRQQLLANVWDSSEEWQDPDTVTEHIRRIRRRIEPDPDHPRWIKTVRGVGYRFDPYAGAQVPPRVPPVPLRRGGLRTALRPRRPLWTGPGVRDPEAEAAPAARIGLDPDRPAPALDDALADREPDARALVALAGVQPLEHGEDAVPGRLLHADAVVGHGHRPAVAAALGRDVDPGRRPSGTNFRALATRFRSSWPSWTRVAGHRGQGVDGDHRAGPLHGPVELADDLGDHLVERHRLEDGLIDVDRAVGEQASIRASIRPRRRRSRSRTPGRRARAGARRPGSSRRRSPTGPGAAT